MKLLLILLLIFLGRTTFAQLSASFTVNKTKACVGDTITMTSTSSTGSSPIVNYIWSAQGAIVESAEGSNLTSFKFVYGNSGTFNLGLIVQDQNGLASNMFKMNILQVFDNPIVQIVSSIINCKSPFVVDFNTGNSSAGAGISYQWNFGSGSPATFSGAQTNIAFASSGNKTAKLTVTNQNTQCSSKLENTITLTNFIADFQFPTSICKGVTMPLTDLSTIGANQWTWSGSFAQFSSSGTQNPSVVFFQSGNQTVTLVSKNTSTGCSDTVTHTVNVLALPNVSFTTNKTIGCASEPITFSNTSSSISGATFLWNFGDGATFSGANPPIHTYTKNNVLYFPTLKMTGANGCTQTYYGDTIYLLKPEANFEIINPLGCEFRDVTFIDRSFSPNPITNWFWDFDDGTTSTLQNPPIHTFPCGTYDVKLAIQIAGGCRDTIQLSNIIKNNISLSGDTITTVPDLIDVVITDSTITRMPNDIVPSNNFKYLTIRYGRLTSTDFTYFPALQCGSKPVFFEALDPTCPTDGDIVYNWAFEGFSTKSVPKTSSRLYDITFDDTLRENNPMDVSLEINFRECISPWTDKIDIIYLKGPIAKANFPDLFCNKGPGPHTVNSADENSIYGHIGSYIFNGTQVVVGQASDDVEVEYDWGDGSPNTLITDDTELEDADKGACSHTYPSGYGTYIITQTITNHTTGCSDKKGRSVTISFMQTDFVFDMPDDDSICLYTPYTMTETSTTFGDHYPISYNFRVIDTVFIKRDTIYYGADPNSTFPISNPHLDTFPGSYNVKLSALNYVGCGDTATHRITILDLPLANISLLDDTVCNYSNAQFSPSASLMKPLGYQAGWKEFQWSFNNGTEKDTTYSLTDMYSHLVENQLQISLQVVDGFGCVSRNKMDTIIFGQKPAASFTTNPYLCNNTNELLDASSSSGIGSLTYTWFLDSTNISSSSQDSLYNTILVSPPDFLFKDYTYRLIVTDNKGCLDTLDKTITISNPRILAIDTIISAKYIDANGNYTCPPVVVDFNLTYESNWPVSNFQWSFGNDFDTDIDSYNQNPTGIQYVQAGNYTYEITITESVTGCQFSKIESPFLVIGGPSADAIITIDSTDLCNQRFLFEILNPSSNLSRWTWNLGDGNTELSEDNPTNSFFHTYLDVTSYQPSLILIDDSTNCTIPISLPIEILDNGVNAFFTATPLDASLGQIILFDDESVSVNSPIVSWMWDFGDNTFVTLGSGISQNHIYINDQHPIVVLTIKNQLGCTDQYHLPLILSVDFIIPNIITNPGGNGVNSIFTLFANIFEDFDILIVNRWGNIIYEGVRDPLNPLYLWNGIDQKSGKPVVDDTYFYVINGTLIDKRVVKFQDFVTVVNKKD